MAAAGRRWGVSKLVFLAQFGDLHWNPGWAGRLTESLADFAAPVLPGNGRLVGDDGLLGNDEAVLAVIGASARDFDGARFCVGMRVRR